MWPLWAWTVNERKQGQAIAERGAGHMFPEEVAEPGSFSSRDVKKLDSAFELCEPDDPNFRNENRAGALRDGQVEIPEASDGQRLHAGDVAPAFRQIKGHTMADMLEVIGCRKANDELNRHSLGGSAVCGLIRKMGRYVCS